jgi:hypothetical protein
MTKYALTLALVLTAAISLSIAAPASTAAGQTECVGTLPPGTYQSVSVPSGAVCFLFATHVIVHDLRVEPGGNLVADGTQVGGSIDVRDAEGLGLVNVNVEKDVRVTGLRTSFSFDLICGSTIGKNLVLEGNTFTSFFAGCIPGTGPGNVIGNNLIVGNNTGGMLQINDEQIGGNLELKNNQGTGPWLLNFNQIGGSLSCEANDPPPNGVGNVAEHYHGQCSGPGF